MTARLIAIFGACLALVACQSVGQNNPAVISFDFDDWPGPPLEVHAVEPVGADKNAPVVIVMHGVRRNADEYRDNWIDLADQYGLRVYVPEFDRDRFPGAKRYNLGERGSAGVSAFDAIEPLFRAIQSDRGSGAETFYLFGHSAGAQFVHRAVCFNDMPGLALAISANAGWYTMPDPNQTWPYGLQKAPESACEVKSWLAEPLIVLLGTEDTDPNDPNLRRAPEAMKQGQHRLERGVHFFDSARTAAKKLDVEFAWRIGFVDGVAHDNAGMAVAAIPLILDHSGQTTRPSGGATQ